MMIFGFFFMLFYTVTHAILATAGFIMKGIFKIFGFVIGVGR